MFPKSVPKPSAHNHIDSLIGAGVLIVGTVTFSGCLRLEGCITGDVHARQDDSSVLVIGNEGHLEGEVQAPHVKVSGKVDGPIHLSRSTQMAASRAILSTHAWRSMKVLNFKVPYVCTSHH